MASDEDVDEDWSRRERDPVAASPMVGAKCRGGINDISINDGKSAGQGGDGIPAGLGTSTRRTRDVPRFGALLVEVTPLRPACLVYIMA